MVKKLLQSLGFTAGLILVALGLVLIPFSAGAQATTTSLTLMVVGAVLMVGSLVGPWLWGAAMKHKWIATAVVIVLILVVALALPVVQTGPTFGPRTGADIQFSQPDVKSGNAVSGAATREGVTYYTVAITGTGTVIFNMAVKNSGQTTATLFFVFVNDRDGSTWRSDTGEGPLGTDEGIITDIHVYHVLFGFVSSEVSTFSLAPGQSLEFQFQFDTNLETHETLLAQEPLGSLSVIGVPSDTIDMTAPPHTPLPTGPAV